MNNNRIEKMILALFLLGFMVVGCIGSKAFLRIGPGLRAVAQEIAPGFHTEKNSEKSGTLTENAAPAKTETAQTKEQTLPAKTEAQPEKETAQDAWDLSDSDFFKDMVQRNGAVSKQLGMTGLYNEDNAYVLSNGYVVGVYPYTSTDYEVSEVTAFRDFLSEQGISLLYVNKPVKYSDDRAVTEELGIETYVNDNADRLLARLAEAGVPTLDLRQTLSGQESFFWFYRTDHHWTTSAGKEAAKAIAEQLNSSFGYEIDLSLYSDENLVYSLYEDAWLGEQGKKLGESYTGMEDYTLIVPAYDTAFTLWKEEGTYSGTFDEVLVNYEVFLPMNNEDVYSAASWHYAYRGNEGRIYNDYDDSGKNILVVGDSYDTVTNAFLALGVRSVEGIIMRDFKGSIRDYILENDFDAVVIAYAEFMIGAHDDAESANYFMFNFE